MRIPKIENYNSESEKEVMKMGKMEKMDTTISFLSSNDHKRFIEDIERLCRGSKVYKHYIKFLKDNKDMTKCSFFTNLDNLKMNKVKMEIHHEPFTLFDIATIVTNKYIINKMELNYFKIAEEVMKLHYEGLVGLVPLSVTVHRLYHLGKLFIPVQSVDGNFIKFVSMYEEDCIPEDMKQQLRQKIEISREIAHAGQQDLSVLNTKYIYVEVEGQTFPQLIEE